MPNLENNAPLTLNKSLVMRPLPLLRVVRPWSVWPLSKCPSLLLPGLELPSGTQPEPLHPMRFNPTVLMP